MNKKHYRLNSKHLIITLIIIIGFSILILFGLYMLTTTKVERDLKRLNYSSDSISLIIDNKIDKYLINNNIYSKTLEVALIEGQYDNNLLEEYIYFPYKDYDGYIAQLNSLINIGYERQIIEQVFDTLEEDDIDKIIKIDDVIDDLVSYITNDYFIIDNLSRYITYREDYTSYDCAKVISYVNMFLDYPYYKHDVDVEEPNNLLVIVNKYYKLSSSFAPNGLVKIDAGHSYNNYEYWVLPIVKENFDIMVKAMEREGLGIEVKSAYRSYATQKGLYTDYVNSNGVASADTFSARAGYSEHQTGLAIDVKTTDGNYGTFVQSNEYTWMIKNAHKYGFILRYPDDKTDITGYKFESWHFRYVGNDIAKYIYENDLTFDEYYAMFVANKKD
ncbi:MAG: M15 family metallopeptidase [Bacilli bacterium]|jgi:LAS superfamily LD-carboxypeptidase LdcB